MREISVIMPVYNAEKFLERAISSMLAQTFQNFELILADDGSLDNSYSICQKFERSDSRIRLLHQDNNGVSSARNLGIRHAEGRYITFADADDYVSDRHLQLLYDLIQKNKVEMGVCSVAWIDAKGQKTLITCGDGIKGKKRVYRELFMDGCVGAYVCNRIFVNSIVKDNQVYFNEGLNIREDSEFLMRYLSYIQFAAFSSVPSYYYIWRPDSATKQLMKRYHIKKAVYDEKRSLTGELNNQDIERMREVNLMVNAMIAFHKAGGGKNNLASMRRYQIKVRKRLIKYLMWKGASWKIKVASVIIACWIIW